MGTLWSVQVVAPAPELTASTLHRRVQAALDAVDARMSTFRPDSELARINARHTTDWIPISPALHKVLTTALEVGELTGGAFDVTVAPLVDLWGFGPVPWHGPPDADTLRETLTRVGQRHLELRDDPPALRKRIPGLRIDLSALAKGYAVDQAAAALDALGLRNYLVEVGGELRARGHNPMGRAWRIAVERPVPGARRPYAVFTLADRASATSGDYRNFREGRRGRYGHIIDPRTGRPVPHRLASVTVVAERCLRADALATGLLVLGTETALDLARRLDLAVYLIEDTPSGLQARFSPAFAALLSSPSRP